MVDTQLEDLLNKLREQKALWDEVARILNAHRHSPERTDRQRADDDRANENATNRAKDASNHLEDVKEQVRRIYGLKK